MMTIPLQPRGLTGNTWICRWHADVWSHRSHYRVHPPTPPWSYKGHYHGHEWPTHIPFIPCLSAIPFPRLGYSNFELETSRSWSWLGSKGKVIQSAQYLTRSTKMPAFWEYPYCPMIPHAINSYRIPFIPSQNYFVFTNPWILTKPGTWVRGYTNYYTCIKFESSSIHYNDVIMSSMVSQITSLTIVCWTIYSHADQRKHQSSASVAFVWGIHRWPVNSPLKWPVTWKMFPFDDVIM